MRALNFNFMKSVTNEHNNNENLQKMLNRVNEYKV